MLVSHHLRMNFNETLSGVMERSELNVADLAAAIGVNPGTLYRWLSGQSHPNRPSELGRLADSLPAPDRCLVVLAWLRDFCPPVCAHLLAGEALHDEPTRYHTPLDADLAALATACARNSELREVVTYLARLARGL